MYKRSLCVVILAAGNSSRFGANKLLYPINNIPMYQYTLNLIKKLNSKQTILVTKYPEITKKIDPNIIVVPNYNTHLGQSHSMQLAIKASQQLSSADNTNDNNIDGYLFIVCDQPFLTFASLNKLYQTWQKKDNICALSYKGKRGNPVIFAQKYVPELLAIHGDKGGRVVIQKHLDELTLVEVNSAKELVDIDTLSILNELQD